MIFVVGAQTRPDGRSWTRANLQAQPAARGRRAYAAYGINSRVGKILEIRQEDPGRIHIVIVREAVGF